MRSNNKPSRNLVCCLRSVIGSNDVQTKINTGRAPGWSQDVAFINIEDIGLYANIRETLSQFFGIPPMGGDAFTIKQTAGRENENTRADTNQASTPSVSSANLFQQICWRTLIRISPTGNYDGVGVLQARKTILGPQRNPADGT
jgi:hypothetical protein